MQRINHLLVHSISRTIGIFLLPLLIEAAFWATAPVQVVKADSPLVETISAGGYHTCGVKSDGTIVCWGDNSYGQSTPSTGTFIQVSAGGNHTCGVKSDGTLACWGDNTNGQSTPPAGTFAQVSGGGNHTCGVKSDGTLACWGDNIYGQSTPSTGTFIQVSAGWNHTCGVKSDGTLACWGRNDYAQSTPPAGTFTQVSAGGNYTCGVKSDGTIACWGNNTYGKATPPAGTFTQVKAGGYQTCGVKSDGTVACWGDNTYGQSSPPSGTFTQVSAGDLHNCGLKSDGTLACWGDNSKSQSTPPAGIFGMKQVDAGEWHTCELKNDGTIVCWGDNSYGQSTPPSGTFTQVSAGWYHTCGVKSDGTLACWGMNAFEQSTPPAGTFTQVSAGWSHTCGVKSDGTLACWGDNDDGESNPPSGTFTQVSAGWIHTCGVKNDGTIVCWGLNDHGQSTPPAGTFTQVSTGQYHTCGVKSDGTVACWGDNSYSQSIPPSGTFTQVSAGDYHTCGVKSDGTIACWGNNGHGESSSPPGTFTQVSAGYLHNCGVKSDDTLTCWGNNGYGQSAPFIVSGNAVVAGATLSYTDGFPKTATTDGSGNYSFNVSYGWSGSVTPSETGYTFDPDSRIYTDVTANQADQNYIAWTNRYVAKTGNDSSNDCSNSSSPCLTIAHAISQTGNLDIIHIAAGTYTENLAPNKDLSFIGAGMDATILDGGGYDHVILDSSHALSLTDLTIQNGHTTNDGGGIDSGGPLTLTRVRVADNVAELGGGIYTANTLTMTDSVVSNNQANLDINGYGGGLYLDGTGVTDVLTGLTINGNISTHNGGGLVIRPGVTANLTNVTITDNTSKWDGALLDYGTAHLLNSTIAGNHFDNTSGAYLGGIATYLSDAVITFKNTLLAGNDNSNCFIDSSSVWTSLGNNLDDDSSCNFTQAGDLQNSDPHLGPLADNGGPTPTMMLLNGSPAIDAGTNTGCPGTDQRGVARPQGAACDIGAVEALSISGSAGVAGATLSYTDGTPRTATADGSGNYSFTVSYNWSGTVTPSRIGYIFSPVDIPYSNVVGDQTNQNYTATAVATFADVPTSYWAWNYIERLYHAGITGGCGTSPLIYCPANSVTRAQMAIFLERGMRGSSYTPPPATGTVFGDVPISYWDAAWIEKLSADGITGGCGGGNYCPANPVTRAQMAIFLLRAEHGSSYTPPPATGTVFGDVPISYWDAAWIEQLYAAGITGGCGSGDYCPGNAVTRAQMAVFLVRAFNLP